MTAELNREEATQEKILRYAMVEAEGGSSAQTEGGNV